MSAVSSLRLISDHPNFELAAAVSRQLRRGARRQDLRSPVACRWRDSSSTSRDDWLTTTRRRQRCRLVFRGAARRVCGNHCQRLSPPPEARNLNLHVVDSSADFRYADQLELGTGLWSGTRRPGAVAAVLVRGARTPAQQYPTPHVGHPGMFRNGVATRDGAADFASGLTQARRLYLGHHGQHGLRAQPASRNASPGAQQQPVCLQATGASPLARDCESDHGRQRARDSGALSYRTQGRSREGSTSRSRPRRRRTCFRG